MLQSDSLFSAIAGRVAASMALPLSMVTGRSRHWHQVKARHMCAGLLWETGVKSTEIAKLLHRTRATALNSIKRHRELYATDAAYRSLFDELQKEFGD